MDCLTFTEIWHKSCLTYKGHRQVYYTQVKFCSNFEIWSKSCSRCSYSPFYLLFLHQCNWNNEYLSSITANSMLALYWKKFRIQYKDPEWRKKEKHCKGANKKQTNKKIQPCHIRTNYLLLLFLAVSQLRKESYCTTVLREFLFRSSL